MDIHYENLIAANSSSIYCQLAPFIDTQSFNSYFTGASVRFTNIHSDPVISLMLVSGMDCLSCMQILDLLMLIFKLGFLLSYLWRVN